VTKVGLLEPAPQLSLTLPGHPNALPNRRSGWHSAAAFGKQ
jgi:hypothetical protein